MMAHLVTALLGILFIFLTRKVYYKNFELFTCLLIVINFEYFHLIPRFSEFEIYRESLLVMVLFYFFEVHFAQQIIKGGISAREPKNSSKLIIVFFICLAILGFAVAIVRGQGPVLSIKAIKYYPIILFYFVLVRKNIDAYKFLKYMVILGSIISSLVIMQFVFWRHINIFYFYEDAITHIRGVDSIRGLRILEGSTLTFISTLAAFALFSRSRNKIWLLPFLVFMIQIFTIIKTRAAVFGVLFSLLFIHINYHKRYSRNTVARVFAAATVIMLLVSVVQINPGILNQYSLFEITKTDVENIQQSGNLFVRLSCYKYYWSQVIDKFVFGQGILNSRWQGNPDAYVQEVHGYHISDIGIFHMIVKFGIFALLFLVYTFVSVSRKVSHHLNDPAIPGYFILGFFMMPTIDLFFLEHHLLFFAIFLGFLDRLTILRPEPHPGFTPNCH